MSAEDRKSTLYKSNHVLTNWISWSANYFRKITKGASGAIKTPRYEQGEAPVWSGDADYNEKYSGKLYITNRRLFFEYRAGIFRKRGAVAAETQLKDITSMSVERGPWNWNVLVVAARDQRHRFIFREGSPDVLMRRINGLMANKSTGIEP